MLMQFSASTRQLSLVQKDLVLLRQAWEDALDASVVPSRTARECAELERLLDQVVPGLGEVRRLDQVVRGPHRLAQWDN